MPAVLRILVRMTAPVRPVALPRPATVLIGREPDIVAVSTLLLSDTVRLLTLTGPGGTGKTHLALEVGHQLRDQFPGGVWFVPLAGLRDGDSVVDALARVLGVQELPDVPLPTAVVAALAGERPLLILDNCEHLPETAVLVAALLASTSHLTVLTTSRAPLRASGERRFEVPPLALPDPGDRTVERLGKADAVRLFVERAAAAEPGFCLTADNAVAVGRSAADWTGSHSRSSSRPPVSACCPQSSCWGGWGGACHYSPVAHMTGRRISAPSAPRLPGATTCSLHQRRCSSAGSRPSRAGAHSQQPRPCAGRLAAWWWTCWWA